MNDLKRRDISNRYSSHITILLLIGTILFGIISWSALWSRSEGTSIPIVVISLERISERRENVKSQLRKTSYTLFDAVDGWNLTESQLELKRRYVYRGTLNPGQVGCLLSHILIWKRIARDHIPYTLILEDDFKMNETLMIPLLPRLCNIPSFQIMYVGHCFEKPTGDLVASIERYEIRKSRAPFCTRGYIITEKGVRILMEFLNKHQLGFPVDNLMKHLYEKRLLESLSVFPPLVDVMNFNSSVVQKLY